MSRATIVGEIKEQRKYLATLRQIDEKDNTPGKHYGRFAQMLNLIFRALLLLMDKEVFE